MFCLNFFFNFKYHSTWQYCRRPLMASLWLLIIIYSPLSHSPLYLLKNHFQYDFQQNLNLPKKGLGSPLLEAWLFCFLASWVPTWVHLFCQFSTIWSLTIIILCIMFSVSCNSLSYGFNGMCLLLLSAAALFFRSGDFVTSGFYSHDLTLPSQTLVQRIHWGKYVPLDEHESAINHLIF